MAINSTKREVCERPGNYENNMIGVRGKVQKGLEK